MAIDSKKVTALIVAAGNGIRAGGSVPKQYSIIAGKTVLEHAINIFQTHQYIDDIIVVISKEHQAIYNEMIAPHFPAIKAVYGGRNRSDSVLAGLQYLEEDERTDIVLVHDAARIFTSNQLVSEIINAVGNGESAIIPTMPMIDTVKQVSNDKVVSTLDRDALVCAQTPQAFDFRLLCNAYEKAAQHAEIPFTDDASIVEFYGKKVAIVDGELNNIKLTTSDDMQNASERFNMKYENRVGFGLDVHKLIAHPAGLPAEKQNIILGGIAIPHPEGLEGHSDADVVLHAVVDAALGAMGRGDIGQHFPPSDVQYKGADSSEFVVRVAELLKEAGGRVINLDVTLVGERPKILPYHTAMEQKIADMFNIRANRVNVKATTSEKLGFTGRGEGLVCQAVISIEMPALD